MKNNKVLKKLRKLGVPVLVLAILINTVSMNNAAVYASAKNDVTSSNTKNEKTDDSKNVIKSLSTEDTKTTQEEVTASDECALPTSEIQDKQAALMGFSTQQPARLSPSGKEVDKTDNPLGPSTLVMDRVNQLAYAFTDSNKTNQKVYDMTVQFKGKPNMYSNLAFNGTGLITNTQSATADSFNPVCRQIIYCDVDGNGKQELVTLGLVNNTASNLKLKGFVTDYNSVTSTGKSILDKSVPQASSLYNLISSVGNKTGTFAYISGSALLCTAGDFNHDGCDEVAVSIENELYLFKINMTSASLISSKTNYASSITDLEALDTDRDRFPELVVIKKYDSSPATLFIYDGTDLSTAQYSLNLLTEDSIPYMNASVDVGDLLGDGDDTIVIGGKTVFGGVISYIKYHADTESYDSKIIKSYNFLSKTTADFSNIESNLGLKCVSLKTPVSGEPESIVLGGYIFTYDTLNDVFVKNDVTSVTEDSDGVKKNNEKSSLGNITNFNVKADKTYIMKTLVGNFDGNTLGKEQIFLLHYNKWYDKDIVYVTAAYMDSDGVIHSDLYEKWVKSDKTAFSFPSISIVDTINHGTTLVFEPAKSTFLFSNPVISAVIAAAPYYSDLNDAGLYSNISSTQTTYGSGTTSENSESNGIEVNAGVMVGCTFGTEILGVEIARWDFETNITTSFTASWSNSTSVSKEISYSSGWSDDAVIVTIIPYDVYYYLSTFWNDTTNKYETAEITVHVPYSPLYTVMTLTDYNKIAAQMAGAPTISDDVMQHTVGDPSSYPHSLDTLTKKLSISKDKVLTSGADEESSFTGCGVGNNFVTQSITTSDTKSKSYDYDVNVTLSYEETYFNFKWGVSLGAGYTRNVTVSTTNSTIRSGTVSSVPSSCRDYQFRWALASYNATAGTGDDAQTFTVINYMTKPVGTNFPPNVPKNFKEASRTLGTNKLTWDKADRAAGYYILRYNTATKSYDTVATIVNGTTTTYTDTFIEAGSIYNYKIRAYNAYQAIPSEKITVKSLYVTELQVAAQPKITYKEGDALDLSALVVKLILNDESAMSVAYDNFSMYNLTTSIQNGIDLDSDYSGIPITITYTKNNLSNNTNDLIVKAYGLYALNISVGFTVGGVTSSVLSPGKQLASNISLENTQKVSKSAIVTLALYDANGTMVKYSTNTVTIGASATNTCTLNLTLPSDITGYKAKVLVWDGANYSSSTLVPLAEVVQIPLV